MTTISQWQTKVHALAVEKGWHERPLVEGGVVDVDRVAAKVALMHSELSEALEELRDPAIGNHKPLLNGYHGEGGKPEGFVVELADTVIRILDTCEALGLDLEGAMAEKHEFNRKRSARHGGKAL